LSEEEAGNGPLQAFQKEAESHPNLHNVESVYEFVWYELGQHNQEFWISFVEHTVYLSLFLLQSEHFFQNGVGWKRLVASEVVIQQLRQNDRIISLNYDTVFEIAMKQSAVNFCYSPYDDQGQIRVYKPHGSLNLYINPARYEMYFIHPEDLPGTFHYPDSESGSWHPAAGIIPPRLNKMYRQHPISELILRDLGAVSPDTLTFWGVGLTTSDKDLEQLYIYASQAARRIEFINPDAESYKKAFSMVKRSVTWFKTLDEWARSNN
jgi:hypothetical protein